MHHTPLPLRGHRVAAIRLHGVMQDVGAGVTMEEVPIQYFQSVIAIELGVAGALVWEIGFFAPQS